MSKELDYITELERKNRLLGERCNQLLKDKGDLTDQIADIKANCDLAIEGRDIKIKELELELTVEKDQHREETNLHLHAEEYIKSLEKENAELKALIEKLKCCWNCKFESNDYMKEPCSSCSRWLGNIKRKGNTDKWEIKEE